MIRPCTRPKFSARWMRPCRLRRHLISGSMTPSLSTTRTGSLCDCCLVTFSLASRAGRARAGAEFEVEVARRLAETDSPVASLDPRVEPCVYMRDGFVITLWTYYEPVSNPDIGAAEYAHALHRLHAGMRQVDFIAPHFTDRVATAQSLVGNRAQTPDLRDVDRELLSDTLRGMTTAIVQRHAAEQVLHGEPHPGNLLKTKHGLLYTDLETCCRGPVEFDVAHVPEDVSTHYPDADPDLLCECRILTLAMVAAWRWDRDDQLPNGRRMGRELLSRTRAALERHRSGALATPAAARRSRRLARGY